MSNIVRAENLKQIVDSTKPDFNKLAEIHGAVSFDSEAAYAMQILNSNSYLLSKAAGNPDSLKTAVLNVAAMGLTLRPDQKLAYLVPRNGSVCLDISYMGYVHLATEAHAIKWAKAEIVRERDTFQFNGHGKDVTHPFNPFAKDRGEIVGCYVTAMTHDGDYLVEMMSIEEIYNIRDRSEAWKSGKSCPWKTDESEMIKKTVIKRAYKSWPKTDSRGNRFAKAVAVSNTADPIDFDTPIDVDVINELEPKIATIRELLKAIPRKESDFLHHLPIIHNRKIESLEELTPIEADSSIVFLKQIVEARRVHEEKNETTD